MNNSKILDILAFKNISSIPNGIKRRHSNTYLYFQNYCNTIKINEIPSRNNIIKKNDNKIIHVEGEIH